MRRGPPALTRRARLSRGPFVVPSDSANDASRGGNP
jgi:hypothetical protein